MLGILFNLLDFDDIRIFGERMVIWMFYVSFLKIIGVF